MDFKVFTDDGDKEIGSFFVTQDKFGELVFWDVWGEFVIGEKEKNRIYQLIAMFHRELIGERELFITV